MQRNWMSAIALSAMLPMAGTFAATPIGWWSMDSLDAQGCVPDLSGNGRALTLKENVCLTNDAISGMALYNPGNTLGACAQFSCPGGVKARSITMWVKLADDDGTYAYPNGNNSYPHLFNNFSGMRLLWTYGDTGGGVTLYAGSTAPSGMKWHKSRGNWSHLAVVVGNVAADESTADFSIYQDGVLMSATNGFALASSWSTAGATTVSLAGNGGNRTIHGAIDEVKVYDVALTPAEVQEEFEAFANPDAVFAHWTMEDTYTSSGKVYVNDEFGRQTLELSGGAVLTNADHWTSQAIFFSGERGTCASTIANRTAQSLTFAAWLYIPNDKTPGDIISGNSYPRMFNTSNGTKAYPSASKTEFSMTAYYGDSANFGAGNVLASKTHWTHVTLVYDVGRDAGGLHCTVRFYRNGTRVATSAKTYVADETVGGIRIPVNGLVDTVRIGGDGASRPFYGYMDDVWMFCRALDDAEVKHLYCGASPVSAGADFSVVAETAMLHGVRNPATNFVYAVSEYGATEWTLVSAPEGGEGVTFAEPDQLVTAVSLPVEGSYVFRLTNTDDFGSTSDEVTVTRTSGAPVALTVTLSATSTAVTMPEPVYLTATTSASLPRYFWAKKSGPGGVYFNDTASAKAEAIFTAAGEYVLTCTVEDGGASAAEDIAVAVTGPADCTVPGTNRGMVAYWNFDSAPLEELSQTRYVLHNAAQPMKSKVGMGIGTPPQTVDTKAYVTANVTLPVSNRGTATFWMYDDSANQYSSCQYSRVWIGGPFEIQYNNYKDATESSMNIYVNYESGQDNYQVPFSNMRNGTRKGRWSHCAVVFDFSAYTNTVATYTTERFNRLRVYVDGEKFIPNKCTTTATNQQNMVCIAPKTVNTTATTFVGNTSNSRYFPGTLDELRYYTNALSQAEIRRLAWEFAPHNRAPLVEAPSALTATARRPEALSGAAYDDGNGVLSVTWKVVEGNAANVVFADKTDATTSVTFAKAGTYVLRLVASDGELTTESPDVVCEVAPIGFYLMIH